MREVLSWHKAQVGLLRKAIEGGRVPPAYLFCGPRGVGKFKVALAFACTIECEEEDSTVRPCGVCPSCVKVLKGLHPDVLLIRAETRQIKIDQIREFQRNLSYKPLEGRRKVGIIDEAEKMNQAAANSLLKTLEEPPGDSVLVLVTANLDSLLPTVVSRCQRITFGALPMKVVKKCWAERGLSDDGACTVAALMQGVQVDISISDEDLDTFYSDISAVMQAPSIRKVLAIAESWSKQQEKWEVYLALLAAFYRDALFEALGIERPVISGRARSLVRQFAQARNACYLDASFGEVVMAQRLAEGTINKQLMFETLLFKLLDGCRAS